MNYTNFKFGSQQRIGWIDCSKTVAIIAVAVDHCNGFLYKSPLIASASYFSVSLFILLSGISMRLTSLKKKKTFLHQLKKAGTLYLQYCIATLILLVFYSGFFDLKTYITQILNFSIQGPYYFLVFFFQLMLLAPTLISWCEFCNRQKAKYVWHIATILFLCWCSSLFIRFTYILPVHGGGQYLFGGTYIILYYLGILFADSNVFNKTIRQRILILIFSGTLWIFWWLMNAYNKFLFDLWLEPYYGNGFNPPSFQLMIFAIITLFLLYSLFSLLENISLSFFCHWISFFQFLGKYTLYIFMYHMLVKDVISKYFQAIQVNEQIIRLGIFLVMIVAPAVTVYLLQKLKDMITQPDHAENTPSQPRNTMQ